MAIHDVRLAPQEARHLLAAALDRCGPADAMVAGRGAAWSLSGIRQILSDDAEPLGLSECLVLAGVIAHLIESTMRQLGAAEAVPLDLAAAHREAVAVMERCAWAAAAVPVETTDPRVDRALAYVRDHFRRVDLAPDEVARHVGVSRHYLNRRIEECTGRGFLRHVHELRIAEARRLLVVSALSAKEIAAAVGYPDGAAFCRQFKRACKTSPVAFRHAARATSRRRVRGR